MADTLKYKLNELLPKSEFNEIDFNYEIGINEFTSIIKLLKGHIDSTAWYGKIESMNILNDLVMSTYDI